MQPPEAIEDIVAVTVLPRLCYNDNWECTQHMFHLMGIRLYHGGGVYKEHSMCRVLEDAAKYAAKYIIVVDINTTFSVEQVRELMRLMDKTPDAFAIWPAMMRHQDSSSILLEDDPSELKPPLSLGISGHLGLTIFRAKELLKLPTPWMVGKPDDDGCWDTPGSVTPEAAFWKKIKDEGHKVYQANYIRPALQQRIVTWSDDKFGPVHQYLQDWQDNGPPPGVPPYPSEQTIEPVEGVLAGISMPELCFSDVWYCAQNAFRKLNIPFFRKNNGLWECELTHLLEKGVSDGYEYVLTVDYDTPFDEQHVLELLRLIKEKPDALAIWSTQIRQHNDLPLCGMYEDDGKTPKRFSIEVFDGELTKATAGHFGLTIFRCSKLKELPKPWFMGVPNEAGQWQNGRIDPDWSFWTSAAKAGMSVYQANQVRVGHIQTAVTWCGDDYLPVHQYLLDFRESGAPHIVHTYPDAPDVRPLQTGTSSYQCGRRSVILYQEEPKEFVVNDGRVRLNLGGGEVEIPGYINIDRSNGQEAYPLDYPDNSVDVIRASHILEHFGFREIVKVLLDWMRALKPGGVMRIAVPSFDRIVQSYLNKDGLSWPANLFGGQTDENDFHKAPFAVDDTIRLLVSVGLDKLTYWVSEVNDCAAQEVSLNLEGIKPNGPIEGQSFTKGAVGTVSEEQTEAQPPGFTWLAEKARNVHSQFGEDGVLQAIFERIGMANYWCFEAGAADGIWLSNTRAFGELGWTRVLVEYEPGHCAALKSNLLPKDKPFYEKVEAKGEHGLDSILARAEAPQCIDLLSLDLDGGEAEVLSNMTKYRPRVIIVEWKNNDLDNTKALLQVTSLGGYMPVFRTRSNLILVCSEMIDKLKDAKA